jgi:hypothetical protein
MKKAVVILSLLLLVGGCATKEPPVTGIAKPVQVPELPQALSKKAERLPDIVDPTFGGIIKDGIQADQQYNAVSHQLNKLIDLYACVRAAMNQSKDPSEVCLGK